MLFCIIPWRLAVSCSDRTTFNHSKEPVSSRVFWTAINSDVTRTSYSMGERMRDWQRKNEGYLPHNRESVGYSLVCSTEWCGWHSPAPWNRKGM